ncbi:MAG: apolipoprotein N-acyltransferase [Acetobacterales bacterium]
MPLFARWRERATMLPRPYRLLLAFAAGAVSAAAMPPVHAIPVLLATVPLLLWLLGADRGWRPAFATGWCFGVGFFLAGLYWITFSLLVEAERFWWLVPLAVPLLAAGLGLFAGAAAWGAVALAPAGSLGGPLALAVAWTAMEWLRGWILTGFPWNLMATVWTAFDAPMQAAAATGAYGLGMLTLLWAGTPALFADRRRPVRWGALCAAVLLPLALWAGGAARLAAAGDAKAGDAVAEGVRLRIVQGNVAQAHKWDPDRRLAHLRAYLEMSVVPPPGGLPPPTHVIWPETAVPFFLDTDPLRRAQVAAAAPSGGAVITGVPRVRREPGFRAWNSLVAIAENGDVVAVYDKAHLVPFGEYVPLRGMLPVERIAHGRGDFTAGPGLRTLTVPGLPPFSPLICYEVIFPGDVVAREGPRPRWLLNVTNDAWFGDSAGPYQHFASARLRAVEEGLPLVRAANTGISAVVDAYGRTVARLGIGRTGVLDESLPAALEQLTPFARWGNAVTLVMLLLGTAITMIVRRLQGVSSDG